MLELNEYQILNKIYTSPKRILYRGRRISDGQQVILKCLISEYPTPADIASLQREYEVTKNLQISGIVKPLELLNVNSRPVLVLSDFGAISLKEYLTNHQLSLREFLYIAIQIAQILGELHRHQLIHNDIKPSNILIVPLTLEVKITDLALASPIEAEDTNTIPEGTLAYISPEATGRMNRTIDYRTDFYSLGVTFYEMLTGKLPYDTQDTIELIHSHIAIVPVEPQVLTSEIPTVLSDLVMKLVAKDPKNRYQSAFGIKSDLELCLTKLEQNGYIDRFPLAERDFSGRLQISQKLYGRERELAQLFAAFERVCAGATQMVLVTGYSGLGKSALVREVQKLRLHGTKISEAEPLESGSQAQPGSESGRLCLQSENISEAEPLESGSQAEPGSQVREYRGYFISGKFDQFQRNIPYSALVQAFSALMRQLLTEEQTRLEVWREKLQTALGTNGQIIIDAIPEVELVIGSQPPVPNVPPEDAQNRFNLVFQNFMRVFASKEHPLAMFLDDLQWADSASLKLIQLVVTAAKSGFLLIAAYRDNEVNAVHPLKLTVEEMQKAGTVITEIFLSRLELPEINQLIAETLQCPLERSEPLAELLLAKTDGNPFFINQFLRLLYGEKLLEFDFEQGCWQWNLAQIRAKGMTENVIELLAIRMQKLPEEMRRVLKIAACIGNEFNLGNLAIISEKSPEKVTAILCEAVNHDLVVSTSSTTAYKFVHDRIQQAAYFLIPETETKAIHWKIGKLLLDMTPKEAQEDKIFEIVNQINQGIELIEHQSQRDELAKLNLIAAKKAKSSTAYEQAFRFLKLALSLLGIDCWQRHYKLTLEIYELATETAYFCGEFEEMERLANGVLHHSKNMLQKVRIYEIKIEICIARNQIAQAVKIGLKVLDILGFKFPAKPNIPQVLLELLRTRLALAGRSIKQLRNLPEMTDVKAISAMQVMDKIATPVALTNPKLYPLIICKIIDLTLRYGNEPNSAVGYIGYGIILIIVFGDIKKGYQFGKLALDLVEKFKFKRKILTGFYTCIKHWKHPLKDTLQSLREVAQIGLETKDSKLFAFTAGSYCVHSFFSGKQLDVLEKEMDFYSDNIQQCKQELALQSVKIYHQVVLNLLGRNENPCRLIGEVYDYRQKLSFPEERNIITITFVEKFYSLILCYLFGEIHQAAAGAKLAEKNLKSLASSINLPLFYFYDSLVKLALYPEGSSYHKKSWLSRVKANQKKMKKWADIAPTNFLHKYYLVEAELNRVLGRDQEAIAQYDKAIELAKANEYINEEAIANELTAKFYLSKDKSKIASLYMQEARYCYQKWGAIAKINHLDQTYPQLLDKIPEAIPSMTITTDSSRWDVDLKAITKAAKAISGEIVLDELLKKLMQIVLENAGAQSGCLILNRYDTLFVAATGTTAPEFIETRQLIPVEASENLPLSVINYVARMREDVVLNDASVDGDFITDTYIQLQQNKSILCTPILGQGKLIGILYLENNLTVNAFTPERTKLLKVLCFQGAIALENALLYEQLEDYAQSLLEERDRMAREIHDTLAQAFTGIIIQSGVAERAINKERESARYASGTLRERTLKQSAN